MNNTGVDGGREGKISLSVVTRSLHKTMTVRATREVGLTFLLEVWFVQNMHAKGRVSILSRAQGCIPASAGAFIHTSTYSTI